MKEIELTKGFFAQVDDEDFEQLNQFNWHARLDITKSNNCYAQRRDYSKQLKKPKMIKMHRVIMGVTDPKIQIDHIDGNGLNNQKSNLRIASNAQNSYNSKKYKNSLSPFKGVYFHKATRKWSARLAFNKKRIYLGEFETELEAARAYNVAAKQYFGEFARINVLVEA